MENKMTLKEQINAIAFETLTQEQFNFLVERALKSVRTGNAKAGESKAHKANMALAEQAVEYIAGKGEAVTASEIENALELSSNQKAVAVLKAATEAGKLVKTEGKGKVKATWNLA